MRPETYEQTGCQEGSVETQDTRETDFKEPMEKSIY